MTHMGFSPFVEMVWLQSSCFFGEDERPLFRRERRFFYLKAKSRENGKPINISLCVIFLIQSLSFWQRHWGKNQQRRGWRRMPFIHPSAFVCFHRLFVLFARFLAWYLSWWSVQRYDVIEVLVASSFEENSVCTQRCPLGTQKPNQSCLGKSLQEILVCLVWVQEDFYLKKNSC